MILSELKQLALDLLGEKGNYWPDAQLSRIANLANRTVYRAVANRDPSHFAEASRFTYPAETRAIDLSSAAALNIDNEPYRVLDVAVLPNNAEPSSENVPVSMENIVPEEAHSTNALSQNPYQYSTKQGLRWMLDHTEELSLVPIPSSEVYLWVRYTPVPKVMTAGTAHLLTPDGTSPDPHAFEYHDLVVAVFMKLLSVKERRDAPEINDILKWLDDQIRQSEVSRTNNTKIIYESPY
jgi:hypothetical protein